MKIRLTYLILASLAAGCGKPSQPPAPPLPTVTVAPVLQRDVVTRDEFTGRLDAVDSVEIRPRVSGYLEEVRFRSGQLVKKGDVLFVIDPRTRRAGLDRSEAELARATAQAEIAERDARRADRLIAAKTISPEEADQRIWGQKQAAAAMLAAKAAKESARLELEFCEVKSPIDGRVGRALVTVGNNVSGVDGFTTLMTTVVSVDPIYAYSAVDEASFLKLQGLLREGRLPVDAQGRVTVEMRLASETGHPHKGYLESLDNRIDAATGSIVLRTVFPNPDGSLLPGLYSRVSVPGSAAQPLLLIDETAIGTDQNQRFVLTVGPTNTVEYRPVQLGGAVDGKRIVRSGLKAGENIIVNGLMQVRPGMPVNVMTADEAGPAPQH